MHDRANELRRMPLPRTPLNKGMKKAGRLGGGKLANPTQQRYCNILQHPEQQPQKRPLSKLFGELRRIPLLRDWVNRKLSCYMPTLR